MAIATSTKPETGLRLKTTVATEALVKTRASDSKSVVDHPAPKRAGACWGRDRVKALEPTPSTRSVWALTMSTKA